MTTETPSVDEAITRAESMLADLCAGRVRWALPVPADPARDPDLVLAAGFEAAREAIRERDEAVALLRDLYRAGRVEADWCVFCEHPGDGHYEECQFHPVRAFLARFPEGGEG